MVRWPIYIGCAAALAIGLLFIFVWAPHPWGWAGFDGYQDFALTLARGGAFPTIDQPWGYAYFLAFFYKFFGNRPVLPLVAQALLNALLPWLVYEYAASEFDKRVAAVAALLTGFLCLNTVYASTQSSDSVCTVIFMTAVLLFARARRQHDDWRLYAIAGLLLGLAPQFRPNLILIPAVLAAFLVVERRTAARLRGAAVVVLASIAILMPWTIRNAQLTGELLPTSTHGGAQLWYGTLQTGPYLASRAHNPRAVFETGTFPYTSLDRVPLVVTGRAATCAGQPRLQLVYWTDRHPDRRRVSVRWMQESAFEAEIPAEPAPTVFYFYVDGVPRTRESAPYVYFVSHDHVGDLDRHGDVLDVFDIARLMRHVAWGEPVVHSSEFDLDGDGQLTGADVALAADTLLAHATPPRRAQTPARITATDTAVSLWLEDGSTLTVPRAWSGRVTDLEVSDGGLAATLLHMTVPSAMARNQAGSEPPRSDCVPIERVDVNTVFYRGDPQAMRRYFALALDNIRRDPGAFLRSAAFRAARVFWIEGSTDPHTNFQFAGSGRIYQVANALTVVFLALFLVGIPAAARRGASIVLPLVLIAYIPVTLAVVLTNMRYSITVEPLMFVFVAAALVTGAERAAGGRDRASTQTARQL